MKCSALNRPSSEVKQRIVGKPKEKLEPLRYVYALWLEGADANSTAGEYSDIDIWADIADENVAEAIYAAESAQKRNCGT